MNDERRTSIGEDASVASGHFHRILMPLISLTLFFVAIAAIHHLLTEVSYPQLVAELKALSWNQLLLALLFTASSFTALIGYDWSALAYIGRKLPFPTVALGSFCGYAISNTVGLSILSGGSVRYRFYLSAGLDAADIARVSVFSVLALSLGIYLVGAAALVIHPAVVDSFFRIPPGVLRWIGIAALVLLFALVVFIFVRRARIKIGPWDLQIPSTPAEKFIYTSRRQRLACISPLEGLGHGIRISRQVY
jgi:phosphatidylglycerol lysyltransferase